MIEDLYGRRGAKMITCDGCGDGFEAASWDEARQRMKDEHWKTRKVDGGYHQFCQDCAECLEDT